MSTVGLSEEAEVEGAVEQRTRALTVAICIATCMRPDGLRRLLEGLDKLQFARSTPPNLRVIVIDNDPAGSAAGDAAELSTLLRWPLEIAVEERQGIPFARNAALARVGSDADFVAFIDDDEIPDPFWMDELLYAQQRFEADVVTGPVIPHLADSTPAWLAEGGFFDRERLPTGTRINYARTGNVLVRYGAVHSVEGWFDERLAFTGGSDTLFFRRLHSAGHRFVFANEAIVHEWFPAGRTTARWVLHRAYRQGNTESICEWALGRRLPTTIARLWKGCIRVGAGLIFLVPAVFFSGRRLKTNLLKALRISYRGAGMIAGVIGHHYEEYRTIHRV